MAIQRNSNVICAMAAVLFVAVLWPTQGWSQDLPEGVSMDIVAEHKTDIPGIEKVELRKLSLQPGAEMAFTLAEQLFCHATDGVISVVDHTNGTTTLYQAGSHWAPTKGTSVTISNPGDDIHVHWAWALIEKM